MGSLVKSENCHRTASPPDLAHCAPPSSREVRHCDAGKNSPTRTRNGGFANIGNTNTPGLPGLLGILHTWVTRYLTIWYSYGTSNCRDSRHERYVILIYFPQREILNLGQIRRELHFSSIILVATRIASLALGTRTTLISEGLILMIILV